MGFHAKVVRAGHASDVFVVNSLIQMYANCGEFDDARNVFDGSPHRDVVSWNAMITGFVSLGLFRDAFDWFEKMLEEERVEPDSVTVMSLASACSRLGDLERGRWLHRYSAERGLVKGNLQLSNALVDMHCKCEDLAAAREIFDGMGERDVLTWTSMIAGLANSGSFRESLELFGRMQQERILPDEVVIVAVLSACAQTGALDQGKYVHLLIDRFKINRDVVLETALIDMYAKCGSLDCAMQVFEEMKERNVFTWNAMICGLAMNGQGRRALELFKRMENEGVLPDDVTFIGLLSGCSHCRFVDEGLRLFNVMNDVYNVKHRMEHYGCVVDLLGRARLLEDALAFIERMPIKPNAVLWASLIGACITHGDTELAEKVSRRVVELEPDSCGRYVMLSNFYAGARRFDEALEVRKVMKAKGIGKIPGLSWIELNGTIHQFVAGERSHFMTEKIHMMVEEMYLRVKSAGHDSSTSEVLFDIDEEEKDQSLFLHSEKLAVAFGLISTVPGSPIRVTKNLRVCGDCHSFLKAVSKVFGREIVARDRNRFHHFRDGLCSCDDFW